MSKSFDYIVVGSGSAGSIVAARLSEDPSVSVLLLEAGGRDNHLFMPMPIAFPKVATDKRFIWSYETEPEPGLLDRTLPIWRGKTLGGCSSINAMINVRGSRFDMSTRVPAPTVVSMRNSSISAREPVMPMPIPVFEP